MPRGPKPTKALFIVGRVRVVEGKNGRFRVLWYEAGRQRERKATSLERAKEIAREEDARLEGISATGASADRPFGELVLYAIDPQRHQWSRNWAQRQLRYANLHILRYIGNVRCSELDRSHCISVLDRMVEGEYSKHTINHVRKVLATAVAEGVRLGIWEAGRHPMLGVKTPGGIGDGKPDAKLIPTAGQVEELIQRMRNDRPIYGAMAELSAFTGIRWGELLALRTEVVDLDRAEITVNLVCVEDDRGRFQFRAPSKSGAARIELPPRTVPLESRLVRLLGEWIEQLPERPRGPHVDGDYPDGLLFTARNGNPLRRSAFHKVFWRHANQVEGWEPGTTWHYLRHFCATRWLLPPPTGLGVEPPTASKWIGHSSVATTYEWYLGTDPESDARARQLLP